jgi:hypothetical protein
MFKVGQKIMCTDDAPARNDCGTVLPLRLTKGEIYTVRAIHTEPHIQGYGVRLEELLNPSIVWADGDEREWSYQSERFVSMSEWGLAIFERAKAAVDTHL